MIKIATLVSDLIQNDEIALESLRLGYLNFSSYARKIKPEIEKLLMKKIRNGTIVTSLSRLSNIDNKISSLRPVVQIDDISIKYPLVEISFDRNNELQKEINTFHSSLNMDRGFVAVTSGLGEVSIILPGEEKEKALKSIHQKPKGIYDNLVAVTIRFNESEFIEVPNVIYTLVAAIAAKRINLIEIVSTFTEISFIVREKDMENTINALKGFLVSK